MGTAASAIISFTILIPLSLLFIAELTHLRFLSRYPSIRFTAPRLCPFHASASFTILGTFA
ncbi:hypothetical protein KIM372_10050 [Bombiscardovia nodaiensis]|uniref:Uncharacterized protein n=1 Tax=Bombiscardovia nodaiensis TaxID=2932181 RepID=A0ABM8B8A3_9BIFI|nr:hypothetical protein KIM372_10050 [Bombiscardovia nodaiensis]